MSKNTTHRRRIPPMLFVCNEVCAHRHVPVVGAILEHGYSAPPQMLTLLKAPKCVYGIRLAGTVHDVGKIGVPTEILSKPGKLRGEQVLLETHILLVADVAEAMSSHRPCRPGLGIEKALMEIEANRGVLYDAQAVKPVWGYSGNGGLRSIRHIEETDAMDDIPRSVCRDPIRPMPVEVFLQVEALAALPHEEHIVTG